MLLKKLFNVGFDGIRVRERKGFGIADCGRYPLFAPDFIEFLSRIVPSHRHAELVFAVVVTAHKPDAAAFKDEED